jgi:hypothetical protein
LVIIICVRQSSEVHSSLISAMTAVTSVVQLQLTEYTWYNGISSFRVNYVVLRYNC